MIIITALDFILFMLAGMFTIINRNDIHRMELALIEAESIPSYTEGMADTGFFIFCSNIVLMMMLGVKLCFGAFYTKVIMFPKKIEHDFLYRGKIGHILWRVQKVKQMRKATEYYFLVSVVVLIFN
jgi:hypothetical protein